MFIFENPFYPMAAMILLIFSIGFLAVKARVSAVRSGKLPIQYFELYPKADLPESVIKSSRHFLNLFEVPVLFFAACLAALSLEISSPLFGMICWLFVLGRITHAWIHLGANKVQNRLKTYIFSNAMLAILWLWLLAIHLQNDLFS